MSEDSQLELAPDSRCIFKVNFTDKTDSQVKTLVIDDSLIVDLTSDPPKAGRGRRQLQDRTDWLAYVDCGNEAYANGLEVYATCADLDDSDYTFWYCFYEGTGCLEASGDPFFYICRWESDRCSHFDEPITDPITFENYVACQEAKGYKSDKIESRL